MKHDLSTTVPHPEPRCRSKSAAVSFAMLNAAALVADLDAALQPLMAAAGVTDGDVAGQFFACEAGEQWPAACSAKRIGWLVQWLLAEDRDAARLATR